MKKLVVLLALTLTLVGCSSSSVDLTYSPMTASSASQATIQPLVAVGDFADQRGEERTYLGTIRGGFGNPLKRLYTNQPLSDIIGKAFADGLAARGLLGHGTDAPYKLTGSIENFDANQMIRREANAAIQVQLAESATGRVVMTETFKDYVVSGATLATGIFGSVEALRDVSAQALQHVVDKALDSNEFRAIAK